MESLCVKWSIEGKSMKVNRYYKRGNISECRKIIIISDVHNSNCVDDICEIINHEIPDYIFLVGDIFSGMHYKNAELKVPFLMQTNAKKLIDCCVKCSPTYMSLGNHEYRMTDEEIDILLFRKGIYVLENSFLRCGDLLLGGLSYLRKSKSNSDELQMNNNWINEFSVQKGYHILLSHHPEIWINNIANSNVELTISGHTHGGQWRVFNKGVFAPNQGIFPKYSRGFYEENRLIVCAGAANSYKLLPRVNNPCEILLLELIPDMEFLIKS